MKIEDVFSVVSDSQNIVIRYERPSMLCAKNGVVDEIEGNKTYLRKTLINKEALKIMQIYPIEDDLVVRVVL